MNSNHEYSATEKLILWANNVNNMAGDSLQRKGVSEAML